jgi:hypothetical protein
LAQRLNTHVFGTSQRWEQCRSHAYCGAPSVCLSWPSAVHYSCCHHQREAAWGTGAPDSCFSPSLVSLGLHVPTKSSVAPILQGGAQALLNRPHIEVSIEVSAGPSHLAPGGSWCPALFSWPQVLLSQLPLAWMHQGNPIFLVGSLCPGGSHCHGH